MSGDLENRLEQFPFEILEKGKALGDLTIVVSREKISEVLRFLRDAEGYRFDLLVDLSAVDFPNREERFEVIYHLYSTSENHRLRVKVRLPFEEPMIDSATDLWKAANWYEREVYDMFGIRFNGHPNLKRLLLPDGFEGHPLRKDYPMGKRQKIPVPVEVPS
ncbi:MAG: NADH-quinone oxidoreductase subunit C [Deltaproteobacteria bacterium]|nr:NADH-quinone oxidoreductase subunit C [Deltaproteobacteria bacterium]